jgi:hypothetical protein
MTIACSNPGGAKPMKPSYRTRAVFVCAMILLACTVTSAGKFGEHKIIGDRAFKQFLALHPEAAAFLKDSLGITLAVRGELFLFSEKLPEYITYGTLTGLSADHAREPIELYASLESPGSRLSEVERAQLKAIANEENSAGDIALTLIQPFYPFLSLLDEAHFYEFGKATFEEMMADCSVNNVNLLIQLRNREAFRVKEIFEQLRHTNAVAKYCLLHTVALECAYTAGFLLHSAKAVERAMAIDLFRKSLMYNSFADHYLQDSFASGHLTVKRSQLTALDNMGTHNYYNQTGLEVQNEKGDRWRTYGDGAMDFTPTVYQHAVEANIQSLVDLWQTFVASLKRDGSRSPLDSLTRLIRANGDLLREFRSRYAAVISELPLPISRDSVSFANSRLGLSYGISGGTATSSNSGFGAVSLGIGFPFSNFITPKPSDPNVFTKESYFYGGLRGFYHHSVGAGAWSEWSAGFRGIISDLIIVDLAPLGHRCGNGSSSLFYSGSGIEYKPVTWPFGLSLTIGATFYSVMKPAYTLALEFNYY